jgi:hypothetical protein
VDGRHAPHRLQRLAPCHAGNQMPPYATGENWAIDTWWAKLAMFAYILKRLLLMVPTLLGVLLLTFAVIQFVPGGPVEQYLAEAKAGAGTSTEGGGLSYRGSQGVDPKRIEQIKALYGFDKPAHERFCRCWGSSPGSTWARVFSRTRMSAS